VNKFKKICIIGSGNVAKNLAYALSKTQNFSIYIWARDKEKLDDLATFVGAKVFDFQKVRHPDEILFILCIKDDAINTVAKQFLENLGNQIHLVHTSGTATKDSLGVVEHYGVFYPLQTFTRDLLMNFDEIPICITSNSVEFSSKLELVAQEISKKVKLISDEDRAVIHLSAVFANNFTNRMIAIAQQILKDKNIESEIINPLISETFRKIQLNNPTDIQTGPAKRKDLNTINKHINMLKNLNKNWMEIYEKISNDIMDHYK